MRAAAGQGPDEPSSARITNYLLGGTFCTAADEALAAEIEAIVPQARQMAADSRLFTARAVTWAAADRGIGQFLDLGAGCPHGPSVHDLARHVRPGSRVAYVDSDDEAADWLRWKMPGGDGPGVAVIGADLSRPGEAWGHAVLHGVIDPELPACILLTLVLQRWSPAGARALVRGYAELAAPGSIVTVSVPHIGDERTRARLVQAWPVPVHDYGPDDLETVLGGLGVAGTGPARKLRPGQLNACGQGNPPGAYVIGGIGVTN